MPVAGAWHAPRKAIVPVTDQLGSSEHRLVTWRSPFPSIKSTGNLERTEVELAISGTDFNALWPLTDGRRLVKTRVDYPLSRDLLAEVDTFDDRALILVEVEFASGEQARAFVPPRWFGRDVTDDPAYKNRNLAR